MAVVVHVMAVDMK